MKVVVCIKVINSNLLGNNSDKKYIINPYDVFALKEAVKLKKKYDYKIVCILMGRTDKRVALELYCLGADRIIFLTDDAFAGADTLATTYVLSEAIKKLDGVKYVFCGDHSLDGETSYVGSGIAQRLGYCFLNNVINVETDNAGVLCSTNNKEYDCVFRVNDRTVICTLNCILKEITIPLMKLRRLESTQFELWNSDELELDVAKCGKNGSRTSVVSSHSFVIENNRKTIMVKLNDSNDFFNLIQTI